MLISTIFHRAHQMMNTPIFKQTKIGIVALCLTLGVAHNAYSIPAQKPLFQSNAVKPIMMLNMSKDHQLYFKVYDDYSDLDKDGIPDTTYKNSYDYYGYFDSKKCYSYSTANNRFEPTRVTDPTTSNKGYCNYSGVTTEWSGNFLNWASMTRIDSVRKILYGGLRSTDTATDTVLERAFLPSDAHSFAKFYNGADLAKVTPFNTGVPVGLTNTALTGITICNTTPGGSLLSQNVTSAPLLRVAQGDYTFWASNERWQCRWNSAGNDVNGNQSAITNVYAVSNNPVDAMKLGIGSAAGEYYARVKVCVANLEEDNCYQYPSLNKKPQGLLQEFGEPRSGAGSAKINFGLMTGSYSNNKAGGILRKAVDNLSAEVNAATDGTFTGANGAIKTLNSLRIYGYRYADGTYFGEPNSDACSWALGSFASGSCSNWGNPQAEIYLESLRYLAGKAPNPAFNVTTNKDSSKIAGVTEVASWTPPVTVANYCAPLNVLQFNASSTSYDGDELTTASDVMGSQTLESWTNKVGTDYEALSGDYFVGKTATNTNELCTAKTIGSLSDVRGTCPDAPRLEGSYQIAGLASFARRNDLIPDTANPATSVRGAQTVRTYGVALAPALPKVIVPVPGSTSKTITILPACRNKTIATTAGNGANCAIVDFKILDQTIAATDADKSTGTLYVNWEDSEQGGDYDQDLWGIIKYEITATKVKITTDAVAQSSGDQMGFGFVVNGTSSDGFHVLSGINNFSLDSCTNCVVGDSAKSVQYDVGTSVAKLLESPLYYAAKWGGYSDAYVASLKKATEDANQVYSEATLIRALKATPIPSTYYFATDPRALKDSLTAAFNDISAGIGAASSVATVSAKVSEGAFVYQAQFNSEDWSGALYAYGFNADGSIRQYPELCTSNVVASGAIKCSGVMPTSSLGRKLLVNNSGSLVDFNWGNLTPAQQANLKLISESTTAEAIERVDWLSGNNTYEQIAYTGGIFRHRGNGADRKILGDLVNSNPVYVGTKSFQFNKLPGDAGRTYRAFVETKKTLDKLLLVGSNDGMLHAFNADTLVEKFAFIPDGSFSKLAKITAPDYGSTANPHGYLVDGPLTYSDVFINNAWRRVVVGTMGAGARSVFAIDVTNAATPSLLFEISSANYPDLGYVLGKPAILPMQNGRWAAIFGNGDSSGAFSKLFVVDLESPLNSTYTKVLSTSEGTGLSGPAITIDTSGRALVAYAGDINGNLWRFSLTDTNPANWKKDYKIFKAISPGSPITEQPITATPTLGINASKDWKTMVYFGTGKYYDQGDESAVIPKQAIYAIADIGTTVLPATLLQKTMTTIGTTSRVVPNVKPDWATQNGWYLIFGDTAGERVTTKPILLFDKLIFATLIPSSDVCAHGGGSWLMEIPAVGDKYTDKTLLSPNLYDDKLTLGNINVGFLGDNPVLVTNPSTGERPDAKKLPPVGVVQGRESWRQVQ